MQNIETESEILEFKESLSQWRRIIETISAFSNTRGGTIIVGVNDKGKIIGVSIGKSTIEDLTNKIITNTEPRIYPEITFKSVEGKDLIFIKVERYPYDVVLAFGKPYKRLGKSTIKIGKDEYKRKILEIYKKDLYFDGQICVDAKINDIDEKELKEFIQKAKSIRKLDIEDSTPVKQALTKLKLIKNGTLTNAGVLLFGKQPQDFFIQEGVKCIRFKGIDVTGEMLDFKEIEGNLLSEIKEVENFIFNNISLKAWIEEGKIERQEKWEYPPKAIRESLVNAIVHRDYHLQSKVQVRIFDDRIEFWNPGKFPEGWTAETLKEEHTSEPFNPLIARMFFWVGYVEEVGTGTNKIIKWCKEWELPEPEFKYVNSNIIVILRKSKLTENYLEQLGLNDKQKEIIKKMMLNGKIASGEIQKMFSITRDTANRLLRTLLDLSLIEKKGKGRFIYYILKKK